MASPLLTASAWQQRRAALTALLVILEYTSDLFRPQLGTLLPALRPCLRDPVRAVRRKAAFFFSEAATYCGDAFRRAAPFLPGDIQEVGAARGGAVDAAAGGGVRRDERAVPAGGAGRPLRDAGAGGGPLAAGAPLRPPLV